MKTISHFIAALTLIFSTAILAHSGGHGDIKSEAAIDLAQKSAQMLSFKDQGLAIGKIDASWAQVSKDNFTLDEATESGFIVKGVNQEQVLFFMISKQGRVTDVREQADFAAQHGHQH